MLGKQSKKLLFLLFVLLLSGLSGAQERVVIQTSRGDIEVELYSHKAPVTVKNFLQYVDRGLFTNARFHRTVTLKPDNQPHNKVKIEVIQAGLDPAKEGQALPAIPLERTHKTGIRHRDGTISMARLEPNTASSEFFICLGDQPELDYRGRRNPDGQGFAAFGRVVQGMKVVRDIQNAPAQGQSLHPPVIIQGVRRK